MVNMSDVECAFQTRRRKQRFDVGNTSVPSLSGSARLMRQCRPSSEASVSALFVSRVGDVYVGMGAAAALSCDAGHRSPSGHLLTCLLRSEHTKTAPAWCIVLS